MNMELMVFLTLAILMVASSLMVIFLRNAVHSALSLVAALFVMAVLFLTLNAPMIAVLQIFVYAGAIMVIFLFVIMLLNPGVSERGRPLWWGLGTLSAGLLALELVSLFLLPQGTKGPFSGDEVPEGFGSPRMLARHLFTDFILPFEIASILLLVAIIGAVVLAKREG